MASINPIFTSSSSEQQWLDHVSKTLPKQLTLQIDFDIPVCIFQVPNTITDDKPEAYTPRRIGLGPNHRFRPELYKLEQRKFCAVKRVLKPHQIQDFQSLVVDKLKALVPAVRSCYDMYLDADDDTLAWVFTVDGLFLLDLLKTYSDSQAAVDSESGELSNIDAVMVVVDSEGRETAKDVMMVENQIPLIVLREIGKCVPIPSDSFMLYPMLRSFCEPHSPLKLSPDDYLPFVNTGRDPHHLLEYMYHSIVNNRGESNLPPIQFRMNILFDTAQVDEVLETVGAVVPGLLPIVQAARFAMKLPWDKINASVGKFINFGEEKPEGEIAIPSASKLHDIAGVKFCLTTGGIKDIKFEEEKRTFHLPVITLSTDSEVVLRNLVAYEALTAKPGSFLELTDCVDLMCGIVDTTKDVKLLRDEKIIEGCDLSDDEIAKLFNRMSSKSSRMSEMQTTTIEKVNKVFDNVPRVKAYRFIKKQIYAPCKVIVVSLFSVIVILVLIYEAFCHVYGCSKSTLMANTPHIMSMPASPFVERT